MAPQQKFNQRTLTLRGQWPPESPSVPIDLDSRSRLVQVLATVTPVTIHPEKRRRGVACIGCVREVGQGSLQLLEITAGARWEAIPERHALCDITKVDFGGRYEEALILVGGAPRPSSTQF